MNTDTIVLSVIIPMYNVADTIIRCLNSIDYPDVEIIAVDDGSQDNTAEVISQYSQTHSNVKLIRQKNGGASSARNLGMEYARGIYIMFIDADDVLEPGGLKRIVQLALQTKADVVKYRVNAIDPSITYVPADLSDISMIVRYYQGLAEPLRHNDISDYHVIDGLFLRELIVKNHIRFNTSLYLHEDDCFCADIYSHTNLAIQTSLPLYVYFVASPQSSTHNVDQEKEKKLLDSALKAIEYRQNVLRSVVPNEIEKLKETRFAWGGVWRMISAGYCYDEIKDYTSQIEKLGLYPLDYRWIRVAGLDQTWKDWTKRAVKTFLCNHPRMACFFISKSQ